MMNLQMQRISAVCEQLKLNTLAVEWPAIAERAAGQDGSLADFLEQVLQVESDARNQRSREALLKFAGLPVVKHSLRVHGSYANSERWTSSPR